ncbi:bifunctional DNA-binding transcriptional regulator/O6-methylguanine-DNA methyltransferase Ada [Azotobacter beijerinckii]|uniref:methylated-DNA--[protein]-cysteine S-methyltransferase n=1 Tax=Azotobacter beijerinckii TaxID=170623 RepID=A0A1I4I9M0_9GAMM|nr:bifunctional DNA-binding transcriptional regulator/O6-methylguanine-DNA methyltransferase Ada [Azotobacter beijerinckii]SFB63858.1 DNA-O6-methylguanine--protein-cysteine S-methyltransferase /Transcriptional regulator Ada [Azotobacter beijerinckii]SFL50426.1 DNA-O6-methylguanine--protein-cysteine S-methyltransferase /Transcriptional regulator Ada [Azotobacter beijerinckii]
MKITRKSRAAQVLGDPRWAALLARDPQADGRFVYSVKTTGVYCRPSCPARRARPENVAFHADAAEAERAGFRPCRRCRPERGSPAQERAAKVAALCRFIEAAGQSPTLDELARQAGWSPWHLQRTFKALVGLTPRAYAAAQRAGRMRRELAHGAPVTEALYAAGYGSGGRFHAEADQVLGMTAGRYRKGGAGSTIRFALGQCSLGAILVAQSERGVCAIFLGDDPEALLRDLQERFSAAELIGGDAAFEQLVAEVVGFVEAPRLGLELPLDIRGTAFQQRVWAVLRQIPPGTTLSYAEVATLAGVPTAVRAVARACAANALAVAIPCHRVVRSDGGLSGYRWGVERKRALLEREGQE